MLRNFFKMWNQNESRKADFRIFVVRTLDDAVRELYTTGIKEYIFVPINEATRAVERLGNGHYIATDDPYIAENCNLKLIKVK